MHTLIKEEKGGVFMNVVVVMTLEENHIEKFNDLLGQGQWLYRPNNTATEQELEEAEVVIGVLPLNRVGECKKLKWLQLSMAGAAPYCKEGVLPAGCELTNATGAYGLALAEHMLAAVLGMQKKLYRYYDHQKKGEWKDEGVVDSIQGATVLLWGVGDIGQEFARRVKALGAYTIGVKRRPSTKPDCIDELVLSDQIEEVLPKADIIAMSLPGTPETYQVVNKKRLELMKKSAYLINVGRGTSIDTEALCNHMEAQGLRGVALDVTDPEPLPQEHRMWHIPGIYITPHISGEYHLRATHDKIVTIAIDNIRRYMKKEPLENIVDRKTGYKK